MRRWAARLAAALLFIGGVLNPAFGGAVLQINDEASIDLGFRIQALGISTEDDVDGDGDPERTTDFRTRRARIRLKGQATESVTAFLQTEVGDQEGGSGRDARLIDAWICVEPHPLLALYGGQHMAPASRQNVTGSSALLAIDRPGINYKTLTWGTRAMSAFANRTFADADAGLRGDEAVRDTGMTLFGAGSLSDAVHLKYYGGAYDGIQLAGSDEPRLCARVQVNFGDSEPGYFNSSTYLGTKSTLAIGASIDVQNKVANDADRGAVDYAFHTIDLFAECQLGGGTLSFETAYEVLELDDAQALDHDNDPLTPGRDATRSQGNGYYVQSGYLLGAWQPWAAYEQWRSDAADNTGSYTALRAGLTWYLRGQHANIKAGYERLNAEREIAASGQRHLDAVVTGLYVDY